MNGRTAWIALIAGLVGIAAGFLLANSINRTELTTLRAENERFKSEAGTVSRPDANPELTEEEISATVARAEQNPGDFETQRNVGIAIYRYGAMKQDEKIIRRSVAILERAATIRPDDYDVTLSLANANFDVGYFNKENESLSKARDLYAKALNARPENVDIRTDLGLTYFLQEPPDLERAVAEFRKALDKNPKHEKTLQFLIQTLIKQKKSQEAANFLEQLRAVNPRNESIGELTSMLSSTQPAG